MLEKIVKACQDMLFNLPQALEVKSYLNDRLSEEAQIKYQFGYFPKKSELHLLESYLSKEDLLRSKIVYERIIYEIPIRKQLEGVLENHNLVMPYLDLYGNIIAMVGRTIEENYQELGLSKYKNTPFSKSSNLFGLNLSKQAITDLGYVVVVEGQFDCLKAIEKGIPNIVALGSANMTEYQFSCLLRYTDTFVIVLDNDDGGMSGRERIIKKYDKHANIVNVSLPEGYKDLDLFLDHFNGEDFRNMIKM